jgi:hypothetical protein
MASLPIPEPRSAQPTKSVELSQRAKRRLANKEQQEASKRRRADYRDGQAELRKKYGIKITGALRVHVEELVYHPRPGQRAIGGPYKKTTTVPGGVRSSSPSGRSVCRSPVQRLRARRPTSCAHRADRGGQGCKIHLTKSPSQLMLSQLGANFKVTGAHGTSLQQLWIGNWKPYTEAPRVAYGGCAPSGRPSTPASQSWSMISTRPCETGQRDFLNNSTPMQRIACAPTIRLLQREWRVACWRRQSEENVTIPPWRYRLYVCCVHFDRQGH